MLDAEVVAVSPSSVYRVLKKAGKLQKWVRKASKKGQVSSSFFQQPVGEGFNIGFHVQFGHTHHAAVKGGSGNGRGLPQAGPFGTTWSRPNSRWSRL